MRPQKYVGITGFTNWAQVEAICPVLTKASGFLFMVGVLVSNKTLRGEQNHWPKRYPKIETVKEIFTGYVGALNLVHYNTGTPETLCAEMQQVRSIAGEHCHGFQLNVPWPSRETLLNYHYGFTTNPPRGDKIVLQCGDRAIEQAGKSAKEIARRVAEYGSLIDYVLIDPSCGRGVDFDEGFARQCFHELALAAPNIGVGIAGNLTHKNLHDKLWPLMQTYPDISFDVESGVRDQQDEFSLTLCELFLNQAAELHRRRALVKT